MTDPVSGFEAVRLYSLLCAAVFIVAAKRTPFGTFGGALKSWTATQLAEHAAKGALAAGSVDPATVDTVHFGNGVCTQ